MTADRTAEMKNPRLIERIPRTHRYRVTDSGWRTALFSTRTYNRILRPGLAQVIPEEALDDSALRRCFDQLDAAIERWVEDQKRLLEESRTALAAQRKARGSAE